ncbi:hypothetical protein [Reichenbachiella versicolor]|uniref:hypothetical protein n=1 Tax=Reichenbachiella versicolor TaxID=1821036 RepID=UPI000D6EA756|nr:hypothetical protein [Reichenbachiella versicolor]
MSLQNRETLRKYFRKGNLPSEQNFNDLIDSYLNKVDDGVSKSIDDGLMLSPIGDSSKLMSFYRSIEEKSAAWSIDIDRGTSDLHFKNHRGKEVVTFRENGDVGINKKDPESALDVAGVVSSQGRKGTAYHGKIPGDGKWHPIVESLRGCYAFEVVAGVGKQKTGKYSLLIANALSTYGKSKSKIKIVQAYYGSRGHKLQLRWKGDIYDQRLEIRSRINYGEGFNIQFHISSLWHDPLMEECFDQDVIK